MASSIRNRRRSREELTLFVLAGVIFVALTAWQAKKLNLSFLTSRSGVGSSTSSQTNAFAQDRVIAEGRVATYHGDQVTLSAELVGLIEKLPVDEKAVVSKGDLIAEIKVDDIKAWLAETKARLAEMDAEIRLTDAELKRQRKLRADAVISPDELDRAQRNFAWRPRSAQPPKLLSKGLRPPSPNRSFTHRLTA